MPLEEDVLIQTPMHKCQTHAFAKLATQALCATDPIATRRALSDRALAFLHLQTIHIQFVAANWDGKVIPATHVSHIRHVLKMQLLVVAQDLFSATVTQVTPTLCVASTLGLQSNIKL